MLTVQPQGRGRKAEGGLVVEGQRRMARGRHQAAYVRAGDRWLWLRILPPT